MAIPITCPGCSARMNAPDAAAGKKVKCPKCQKVLAVPELVVDAPAFEVVEDEPTQTVKEPAPRPAAKPQVKADVVVDEDDEDEVRPAKKRARAVVDDDEDEDDRPRKKKKKKSAAGGSSLARNIVGGVVLIVLLGVVAFVFWDKFGKKEEVASNTPPAGDPPVGLRPGPQGPGPVIPKGKSPDSKAPEPNNPAPVAENPYTGEGYPAGTIVEEEAEIFHVHATLAFETPPHWYLSLRKVTDANEERSHIHVFLRPDQQAKTADLWPKQKVKIRGRKAPRPEKENLGAGIIPIDYFYAAEIISSGPAPKFVEMTVDQLLKEFRDDRDGAKRKWTRRYGADAYEPPWIKLTGVFDGPGPERGPQRKTAQLKGSEENDAKSNRVIIETPGIVANLTKGLKKGDLITVRVQDLFVDKQNPDLVRFDGSVFPPPK